MEFLAIFAVATLSVLGFSGQAFASEVFQNPTPEMNDGSQNTMDNLKEEDNVDKKKELEVKCLKAEPRVGKVKLSWELDDANVDHIEISGRYKNEEHFWRVGGFHRVTRSVELDVEPLATINFKIQLVFKDGTRSVGRTIKATALHKNVVFDQVNGRKLLIYLPDGYHNENKKYPVIYMHDGQNLFSDRLAFLWEWRVDEALDQLISQGKMPKTVVVGIYNSSKRSEEYTPFADRRFGGGKAREFSEFVVNEIIPYVEGKYRVSDKREDRAVMGSSFGGILSLWMAYTYPEIFSMAAAISPSLWIADGQMLLELEKQPKKDLKIWIDQGTGEYSDFTRNAVNILLKKGYEYERDLLYYEVKGAPHNEIAWSERIECPFLFFKGKPASRLEKVKLDVVSVRQFAVGPTRLVVNPVAYFDNGLRYSLYTKAEYSIGEKSKATIDKTGVLQFNGARYAYVIVKYKDFEESIVIKNPAPEEPVEEILKQRKERREKEKKKGKKEEEVDIEKLEMISARNHVRQLGKKLRTVFGDKADRKLEKELFNIFGQPQVKGEKKKNQKRPVGKHMEIKEEVSVEKTGDDEDKLVITKKSVDKIEVKKQHPRADTTDVEERSEQNPGKKVKKSDKPDGM